MLGSLAEGMSVLMLYSRIFFIYFIHNSLYLLIPNSLIILPPPPFPFGNQQVYSLCLWVYLCLINKFICVLFSVQFNRSVVSDSLWPHGLQYTRLPCPSPTPGACSNSCPSSRWCRPTILSSIIPFPSCCQSFPASGFFFQWVIASGGQSIGASASASVLSMNIQVWFPLGLTDLISLLSKGLSTVFSNTIVQKHQFFGIQLPFWSNSHIHTWLLEKP